MADEQRCLYFVKPGKAHGYHRGGKYSVCITPKQHAELFGAKALPVAPTPLGCGVFACAYPTADPGKVVKITRDPTDVAALQAAQGVPGVPRLFRAYKLASYARWLSTEKPRDPYSYNPYAPPPRPQRPEPFGLVVERFKTLGAPERKRWARRLGCFQRQLSGNMDKRTTVTACCPIKPKAERFACLRGGVQLHDTYAGLRELGIELKDIHAGNVGRDARGRWGVIDLGRATGTGGPDVPDLAGARRGRKRRKRRR
jgi:hypothetical protein